jgi:hypothetical protein
MHVLLQRPERVLLSALKCLQVAAGPLQMYNINFPTTAGCTRREIFTRAK